MLQNTRTLLWRSLAVLALALGAIGALLPVVPTVPFLLVAVWAASRGWPQLEAWILEHERFGPPIRQWRERGVVARRAKWTASLLMGASAIIVLLLELPVLVKTLILLVMVVTAWWLWLRPEQ